MVLAQFIGIYPGFASTKGLQGREDPKEGPEGQNLGINWIFPPLTGHKLWALVGSVPSSSSSAGSSFSPWIQKFLLSLLSFEALDDPSLQAGFASCVFCTFGKHLFGEGG